MKELKVAVLKTKYAEMVLSEKPTSEGVNKTGNFKSTKQEAKIKAPKTDIVSNIVAPKTESQKSEMGAFLCENK